MVNIPFKNMSISFHTGEKSQGSEDMTLQQEKLMKIDERFITHLEKPLINNKDSP